VCVRGCARARVCMCVCVWGVVFGQKETNKNMRKQPAPAYSRTVKSMRCPKSCAKAPSPSLPSLLAAAAAILSALSPSRCIAAEGCCRRKLQKKREKQTDAQLEREEAPVSTPRDHERVLRRAGRIILLWCAESHQANPILIRFPAMYVRFPPQLRTHTPVDALIKRRVLQHLTHTSAPSIFRARDIRQVSCIVVFT
jgi:hypothetical protein